MFDNERIKYVHLKSKVYIKYTCMGILIDQNLFWKYPIDSIVTKISKNVGFNLQRYATLYFNQYYWVSISH